MPILFYTIVALAGSTSVVLFNYITNYKIVDRITTFVAFDILNFNQTHVINKLIIRSTVGKDRWLTQLLTGQLSTELHSLIDYDYLQSNTIIKSDDITVLKDNSLYVITYDNREQNLYIWIKQVYLNL